jgi:tetratricopeptide (TPR) repeat protein
MSDSRFTHGLRLLVLPFLALLLTAAGCSGQQPTEQAPGPLPQPGTPALTADQYFQQGNDYYQQGLLDDAERSFLQAVELDPNKPAYHANLGVTYYSLGRLQDAEASYLAGLELAPDDAELNYLLGAVYLQLQELDKAQTYLSRSNRADPNLAEAYYGLGVLYKLQGKRDEAITSFERFLELGTSQDPRAITEAQAELESLRAGQ